MPKIRLYEYDQMTFFIALEGYADIEAEFTEEEVIYIKTVQHDWEKVQNLIYERVKGRRVGTYTDE